MSEKPKGTHVEYMKSEIFRTIAIDFYEFWITKDATRFMFYTDHYFTDEKRSMKQFNRDAITRELQAEIRMERSNAISMAAAIMEQEGYQIVCPYCKQTIGDKDNSSSGSWAKHMYESHGVRYVE